MRFSTRNQWLCYTVILFLFSFGISLGVTSPAVAGTLPTADEQQAIDLINQARTNAGLSALEVDSTLTGLARIRAQDMASNNYFSHYSPTYGSSFDMMKKAGVQYRYAGGSLAMAPSVSSAFRALINSSGHRLNMLKSYYDRIGVGIVAQGPYKIIVQMFTGGQKIVSPAPQPQPQPEPQPEPQPQPEPEPQPVSGLSVDEQRMFDLVNQERVKAGLSPLQIDLNVVKLARMKAQDMIDKGYFSHTSPTYGSPFNMMKSYGVQYRYAGENLAGAPTVDSAHKNLMNSSGHRANILNVNFSKVGIGVVNGGPYGKMFVQLFTG